MVWQAIKKRMRAVWMRLRGWHEFCEHGVPPKQAFELFGKLVCGGRCLVCGKINRGRSVGMVAGPYIIKHRQYIPLSGKSLEHYIKRGWKIVQI